MKFVFDENVPRAKEEFDKVFQARHYAKIQEINARIDALGIFGTPKNLVKHLWRDVYEFVPMMDVLFLFWLMKIQVLFWGRI